ncbi:GNAT family N-acetyltransferase [Nocardioides sp. JQ2195]|uniref:GNAT family N-acetyltransferase n=1 Tax=Nocardioides sp. JQ2195 TaxID=2592334 RepID=UPI00143EA9B4|nr:GNAT family N-acetyltransferase [Nocardioides sp. JQ2195]QIX27796.1 GNAT family N-acetyltransferase [Nocardioides sp. JQ2195]
MIREARPDDWAEIWQVFDAIVQDGETYAYPTDLTSEQAQRLWFEQPPARTVVLEEHGSILGTAKMGPNKPSYGAHIGTASFMVSDAARGQGVGRQLGEHVITWHREQGFRGIQFNAVVESNTAAVNLWSDLGFEIIGTVPGAFRSRRHGYVGLHVMFLDLT